MKTMNAVIEYYSIKFCILLLSFQFVKSQNPPPIPCPEVFQYLSYGDKYIGMVTIKTPLQTTVVDVAFSQREPITTSFNGRLSLKEDLQTTQANLESGKPISYRVDFPNSNILPKLTSISVNGNSICQGVGYNAPSTTFKLQHSFFPASNTFNTQLKPNLENGGIKYTYSLTPTTHTVIIPSKPQSNTDLTDFSDFSLGKEFFEKFFKDHDIQTTVFEIPLTNVNTNKGNTVPQYSPPAPPRFNPPPSPPVNVQSKPSQEISCGRDGLTPFVAGGNDFTRGKFPWLVAIYLRDGADLKFRCGGSLISSQTVITAAHCFPSSTFSASLITVYLGRHNLFVNEEGSAQRDISRLILHPNYNVSVMADADIALLQMGTPVSFNLYIRPICLWSQSSELSYIENNKGFIAGWGADNNGNDMSSVAKVAEAKVVSESECLRSSGLFRIVTSPRTLCAGNRDGTGPCIGDSGSGLMLNVFGVWTLRGVVSVGETRQKKCDLNEYVVYCDVAKHTSWVRQNMLS